MIGQGVIILNLKKKKIVDLSKISTRNFSLSEALEQITQT